MACVRIEEYSDQVEEAARAYGLSTSQLIQRDARLTEPPQRWLAYEGGEMVGLATASLRPDGRMFLSFGCPNLGAFRALSIEIARRLSRPLYVSVHGDDTRMIAGLLHGGYSAEVVAEKFDVGFDPVLRLVGRTVPPSRFSVVPASSADVESLSDLDNELRQLVPGSEGWHADSDWVRAELEESPPFDPASYLVGVAPDGSYAGLARIWRNPEGPRFGLVAVKPAYRMTRLGPALIAGVLRAASKWGFDTFTTETSIGNRHIHPRLHRLGARSTGYVYQFVFESEPSGERG